MPNPTPQSTPPPRLAKTAAPATPKEVSIVKTPQENRPHPLERFVGKRVVIQKIESPVIIEGDLRELDKGQGTLFLEHCRVVGTKHVVVTEQLVLFIRKNISHVHLADSIPMPRSDVHLVPTEMTPRPTGD
jgi:hypothetical protein